jgi:3'-5' exoribonuclease
MSDQISINGSDATDAPEAAGGSAAGAPTIAEMNDGEQVDRAFAVRDRALRDYRNKPGQFLQLELGDSSGTIKAMCWDDAEACHEVAKPGVVVWVVGRFEDSQKFGPTIKVSTIRAAQPAEYTADQLAASPKRPLEALEADLRSLIATVQNQDLQRLLECFFGAEQQRWLRFRAAPAAKLYHEAYPGGLLEHTLSVAQGVSALAPLSPGIDRDVAVTGGLLHDIGKTQAYDDNPLSPDFTDAGRLESEIPLGYYLVRREIERIDGFDPDLAQAVLHIILSHHGSREMGSPVVPLTREATLVHFVDNLRGRLGGFDRLESRLADGERWSEYDRALGGSVFFGSRAP